MDKARLNALALRIARLEVAQSAGDARLRLVAKAVEEATAKRSEPSAAVVADISNSHAIDHIAAAAEAAAAGNYPAPRVQLLLPGWGTSCIASTSTPVPDAAPMRAPQAKRKGAGTGAGSVAAAAGSVYIRNFLPPVDEARVEALRASLPIDVPYEANPVSHARSLHKRYFNDAPPGHADAWIVNVFERGMRAALGGHREPGGALGAQMQPNLNPNGCGCG